MEKEELRPFAALETELTVKRSHMAFLHAALRSAGWSVGDDFETVTTDDGYDAEVKMRVRVQVPMSVLAETPDPVLAEHGLLAFPKGLVVA